MDADPFENVGQAISPDTEPSQESPVVIKQQLSPESDSPKPMNHDLIDHKVLIHEKEVPPSSPLLLPQERNSAKIMGHSMDTKMLNDEFYYIDLEKLSFCLAIAIQKHIKYAFASL